jgi:hypothetical protein
MKDVIRSPRSAWYTVADSWRRLRYRHGGTYEDERALMLYYRDRQLQLRRAAQSAEWIEMRQLPGVTNLVYFASKYPSGMVCVYNTTQLALSWRAYQSGGNPYLARAAEAEARRRLMVTALALERYRGRHRSYPADLQALVPELLPSPPLDFMDGKPLRYRLGSDGRFVLYSVGLDCADNGGEMPSAGHWPDRLAGDPSMRNPPDVVWPRPGSEAEAERLHQEEISAYTKMTERTKDTDADDR